MRALALLALAACSVPALSLEGKQCPCATEQGYVCDEQTNRCLPTNDGGTIIDTPAATQCLPSLPNETELYRYTGMFDWGEQGGSWSGTTGEIQQTSTQGQALAYRTSASFNVANVRVISSMRETATGNGGNPALGIALRVALSGAPRYRCMWSSSDRQLYFERDDGSGFLPLGQRAQVASNVTLPPTFTMEASVNGTTLGCCIRELQSARVTGQMDANIDQGFTGLETDRKAAAFSSFVLLSAP